MSYRRVVIYPYGPSTSARDLARELGAIRVRATGNYHYRPGDLIVNWGNGTIPRWGSVTALEHMRNKPQHINNAADKVRTFKLLHASMPDDVVPYTLSKSTAEGWLRTPIYGDRKNAVVCRTLTRASGGRGIVLASNLGELVAAPLYTRYKPKEDEFRVHVSRDFGIIDVTEKRKRNDAKDPSELNKYIRAYDNHWVFCHENVTCPKSVLDAAERAIHCLGLDFGAVDIGYHRSLGVGIYEVNTAPGIEGSTLAAYRNCFRKYIRA